MDTTDKVGFADQVGITDKVGFTEDVGITNKVGTTDDVGLTEKTITQQTVMPTSTDPDLGVYPTFDCMDCGKCTLNRFADRYMLRNELWYKLTNSRESRGVLCWSCAETRAGRSLGINDILPCPLSQTRYALCLVFNRRNVCRLASLRVLWKYATNACVKRRSPRKTTNKSRRVE